MSQWTARGFCCGWWPGCCLETVLSSRAETGVWWVAGQAVCSSLRETSPARQGPRVGLCCSEAIKPFSLQLMSGSVNRFSSFKPM